MRMISVLVFGFLLALGAAGSFAEEEGHEGHEPQSSAHQGMAGSPSGMGQMGTPTGHSGMQHGMGMHEPMRALHDHSKMMEKITDQRKLMEEMKKHMRMMDEMMEQMVQSDMAAAPTETPRETP